MLEQKDFCREKFIYSLKRTANYLLLLVPVAWILALTENGIYLHNIHLIFAKITIFNFKKNIIFSNCNIFTDLVYRSTCTSILGDKAGCSAVCVNL